MARVRMTQRGRRAANPPANPRETPDHPAFEPDPEVGDYGMSSDFAATPTTGPYPNSAHPATPDEGPSDHPAARKAARAKSARQRRRAAERKAAKCIRIAQSMLGPNATTAQVEDQAVDLMDLSDKAINTALRRLSNSFLSEDQNDPGADTLAPEGEPVIQSDPVAEMPLMSDADVEAEELLALMLAEEEAPAPEAPAAPAAPAMEAPVPAMEAPMADEAPLMGDLDLGPMGEDPMGLDAPPATDDILAELFGGRAAADEEADDEEADDEEASKSAADEEADDEEADEEEGSSKSAKKGDEEEADEEEADDEEADDEEASKKSARKAASKQRPRSRKASKGAKTLGAVTKAAAKSEISDLSKLWETAPDVSDVFGV